MNNETAKWVWMTEWCKDNRLSPWNARNWNAAEEAWGKRNDRP